MLGSNFSIRCPGEEKYKKINEIKLKDIRQYYSSRFQISEMYSIKIKGTVELGICRMK